MDFINSIVNLANRGRLSQIEYFKSHPIEVQLRELTTLIRSAASTVYGRQHNFAAIASYADFVRNVPINDYETMKSYIARVMRGEPNVLWPGITRWFAKSSGTTHDRSKFIPVTKDALVNCHFRSGKDIYTMYVKRFPKTRVFDGKTLTIGGSTSVNGDSKKSYTGDLSAILIKNLPLYTRLYRIPKTSVTLLDRWDEKLDKIVRTSAKANVVSFVGVPSWLLVLLKQIVDFTGKNNILDVWPKVELFIHGGVSFLPYKNVYADLIPTDKMVYMETYNASEGFFGVQDILEPGKANIDNGMLLMLDYGIFYEFIRLTDYLNGKTNAIPLSEVKKNENYAMIISTNGGLWRYVIGDTVSFVSTNPYRIKITGRTRHYINAFGEELIIDNVQQALNYACEHSAADLREYTVAPVFFSGQKPQGAHEWALEFINPPKDINSFMSLVDNKLRELNSDYDAKRSNDITLGFPIYTIVENGVFYKWLETKGKLGGQHKIPRLSNERSVLNEIKQINGNCR